MFKNAILVFLIIIALTGCAQRRHSERQSDAQGKIINLARDIRDHRVISMEIIHNRSDSNPPIKITPEILNKSFQYKLIISDIKMDGIEDDVLKSISTISTYPSSNMGDLRWSVSFLGKHHDHILTIYLDGSGTVGGVDSQPVSFEGNFGKWLNNKFSNISV